MPETDFIALRKVPYTDNSLILSGISGEFGRLGFLIKGAYSRKEFPALDIFRLYHVDFLPGREDLSKLRAVDLVEDFGGVAADYSRYQAAAWISAFSMLNVMPNLPHPFFTNAVEVALRRLANKKDNVDAVKTCVALSFIFEEGWLAHAVHTENGSEQCRQLLEMAGGSEGPNLSDDSWREQLEWCLQLLRINECRLPGEH